MRLQPMPGTSWELLEPSHLVSCPELLIANVSLAVPESWRDVHAPEPNG